MLRSMYAGVSGLKAHQVKLDVVGNNIANVNTPGFKSSRVTFKEMLTQTMRSSSRSTASRGGLNPMQIGLGVGLGSIDGDFTQGNLQPTGKSTDIAIEGNGFFVVSDGSKNLFSRAGSFYFDLDGNMVHSTTGFRAMGWMADEQGIMNINPSTMTPLSLGDLSMTPKASTYIEYKGNLDSNKEIVDLSYSPSKMTISDMDGRSAQLYIELTKETGTGTADRTDDKWRWTAYLEKAVNDSLTLGGTIPVILPTVQALSTPPDNKFEYIVEGTVVVTNSADDTVYVEGVDYTVDYTTGEITRIDTGNISSTGTNIDVRYTCRSEEENNLVGLDTTGKVLTNGGMNKFTIEITMSTGDNPVPVEILAPQVGDEMGGSFTVDTATNPGINSGIIKGSYGPSKATSYSVFDSKGNEHTINLTFVKTASNTWDWFAEGPLDPDGNAYTLTGNSGTIIFDATGKIVGTPTGGPISFQPVDAERMSITPDFSQITQFTGDDTAKANSADGFEAGDLDTYEIDATGTIIGYYTNGLYQPIAKLAIATFSNAAGLNRSGNTIFTESNNSGTPDYGLPGTGGRGVVSPGSLEMSNVDLAEQFTEMITAQRGFQASSKIISTADQILQDLVNLKR